MLLTMMDAWTSLAFGKVPSAPPPYSPYTTSPGGDAAGRFTTDQFDSAVGSLRYKLFVPASYDGTRVPLVVMLHGCGQDADDFAVGTGMNELAERFGCLIAYPQQSRGANWHGCWNWFDKANQVRGQGEPALIAGVTLKIMDEYAVDPAHVCVGGLSAGGAMAVIMGRTYPDLYTAVGCHSGLAHGSATDQHGAILAMRNGVDVAPLEQAAPAVGVPTIVFHGDMDTTVHLDNSIGVVRQSMASIPTRMAGSAKVVRCEQKGHAKRAFTRIVHRGAGGEVLAEQWTVHGAGHAWSGGSARGSYTDASGPDASREMLRFFIGPTATEQ